MPLYSAEALILRTYKLKETDQIVVFLTRDRGKKRGVARGARNSRKRFGAALQPLTEVRVAYVEHEGRELVALNYADIVRSPMSLPPDAIAHVSYVAELLDEWAQDADADERLFRLGTSVLDALGAGAPVEPLLRYFECWLLRLQGLYPEGDGALSAGALAFLAASRSVGPRRIGEVAVETGVVRELERAHRTLIAMHLEKTLKSDRVLREMRRHA